MKTKGITITEAMQLVTGSPPEPFELPPELIEQAKKEGQMRKDHAIAERKAWLEQLRRVHPYAIIPTLLLLFAFLAPAQAADESFQIVYNGRYTPNGASYTILDLFEHSTADVERARAARSIPIAYFSAHYEDWRPDAGKLKPHRTKRLGSWAGEWYVWWDNQGVKDCMTARMDLAKKKGFVGVDIDNVDGPAMSSYFPWLMAQAKKRGLLCGLKNSVELLPRYGKEVDFFVIEATDARELAMYRTYTQPKFRMVYGRTPTPAGMYGVRNGQNGNRF